MRTLCTCIAAAALLLTGCTKTAPAPDAAKKETKAPEQPVVYYKVDSATAGTLSGKITFTGKVPASAHKKIDMDEDPQCAKQHKGGTVFDDSIYVGKKGGLADTFVYIKTGLEGKKFEPPADPVVIDQKGCWFGPRIIAMQAGQALKAVNSDPVTHNIHPRAKVNREWNQNQPEGAPPAIRKFPFQEVDPMIRVKCNIHPWMKAWIGVVDNPYFAVTKADGSFELKNVPPGVYTVEAWQEVLGTQEQQVTVAASGKVAADFTFKGE